MSDAESVVEEIKRGPGRPKGSKTRKRSTPLKSKPEPEDDDAERPPYAPDPASIALCVILGNTLWNMSRIISHHRALTEEEQQGLGSAMDPVFYKYLPALENWKSELTLVMCIWGLWQATTPEPEKAPEASAKPSASSATVLEESPA
jgi:hypothetical protein